MKESEKKVERYLADQIDLHGGLCRKYVSPGVRGVPDRLCLMPNGVVVFVELKSEGEDPTSQQLREHERMHQRGHHTYIIDTEAKVDDLIKELQYGLPRNT